MKITYLRIKGYKNLDAELIHTSDLITLIGNNGSGKSNLLEAISLIFRSLYVSSYKVDFDYILEYVTSKKSKVKIEKKGSQRNYFLNDKTIIDVSNYLPQKIVAIYSGEEGRLFDECYRPFYLEFVRNINKAQKQGTEYSELPRMLFLNKFYWNLSLLSLLISDSSGNKKFIKEVLNIEKVDKIKIDFNTKNYENYRDNRALYFVKNIDLNSEYELEDFKKLLIEKGYISDDVFKYLYLEYTPKDSKIIEDITIKFNTNLTVSELSEGEKKLLLIKAALEFAGQEDCIFILDEPDSHIHLLNKNQVTKSFERYRDNRQIIITTHSPTVTNCVADENVYMINNGKIEDRNKEYILEKIVGNSLNKIERNGFISSRKDVILVEGKTDIMHIELALSKLKTVEEKYNDLEFIYLAFGGASGLKLFVDEYPVNSNSRTFAFVDRDKPGYESIKETLNFEGTKEEFKGRIKNNIYIDYIPKKENYSKSNFVIEDYYPFDLYKDFLFQNVECANELPNHTNSNFKKAFAEKAKQFAVVDFEGFKKLFDLILEVKNKKSTNNLEKIVDKIVKDLDNKKPESTNEIVKIANRKNIENLVKFKNKKSGNIISENEHLRNKPQSIKKMYKLLKEEILEKDKTIVIDSKVEYIAFKRNKRNIFDIKIQDKKIILWINKKKGQIPIQYAELFEDCSGKGHHGNGDYEKHFTTEAEVRGFIVVDVIDKILKL